MRVLRPVVQSLVLAMLDAKAYLQPRSAVGSKLVHDHDARWRDGGFQELRHEFSRSKAVSATLDQNLNNEAVLIDYWEERIYTDELLRRLQRLL